MGLQPDILDTVVFIGTRNNIYDPDLPDEMEIGGTGFLVCYPWVTVPDVFHTYVVTARHVAEKSNAQVCVFRCQSLGGTPLHAHYVDPRWHYHEDASVDVALMEWLVPLTMRIKGIPISLLLTDEVIRTVTYGPGDTVAVVGLYSLIERPTEMRPITRVGTVAVMPEVSVPVQIGGGRGSSEQYLIELLSFGGVSGSPVFLTEPSVAFQQPTLPLWRSVHLMGLIHGHFPVKLTDGVTSVVDATSSKFVAGSNSGIAGVVPAKRIREVLDSPVLIRERAANEIKNHPGSPPLHS